MQIDIDSQTSPHGKKRIVLIGNPNCGKTSIFNNLTGSSYKVANYPGVTVERREGVVFSADRSQEAILTDLPGTYSLQGESIDEKIAQQELANKPDLIVLVVDAGNLQRNLYLASEVIDLGIPVVLALNMIDLAEKRGLKILDAKLWAALDLPVVPIVASQKRGIRELLDQIFRTLNQQQISSKNFSWAGGNQQLIELSSLKQTSENSSSYGEVASARYRWIDTISRNVVSALEQKSKWSERFDALCTHRISGILIFTAIMGFMFQSIYTWASLPMEVIDSCISSFSQWLTPRLPEGQFRSLLVDGILAGVGSVLIFIPQIALLFFFIGILEDSGYLSRAAFVVDRIMRKVGLQGRSFIPLLSSFACAIPGIMSTRSIPSLSDRMITILVAPLMSCSARLPVYTLLIAAFIPATTIAGVFSLQGLVMTGLYLMGIVGAAAVALVFRKSLFRGEPTLFVMEMPAFRLPSLRLILRDVRDRLLLFVRNAGTVILACSMILWYLASHPLDEQNQPPPVQSSYAGALGKFIEPAIRPLGFNWQIGIGLISSFAAREVFVSSLATVYNLENDSATPETLTELLRAQRHRPGGISSASALSLLVFYVFACQCMSTLAVCRRETGSWRWPAIMLLYMSCLAYGASLLTYHLSLSLGIH